MVDGVAFTAEVFVVSFGGVERLFFGASFVAVIAALGAGTVLIPELVPDDPFPESQLPLSGLGFFTVSSATVMACLGARPVRFLRSFDPVEGGDVDRSAVAFTDRVADSVGLIGTDC